MLNFIIRKTLSSLITLLLLTMIVYFLVQVIMPGDYVSMFVGLPLEDKARLRQELGLDLPVWLQYLRWLGGLLSGGLGRSFNGQPVMSAMLSSLPPTLLVFLTGGALAFFFGNWLGKSTAWQKRRVISEGTALTVTGLYAFSRPHWPSCWATFWANSWAGSRPMPIPSGFCMKETFRGSIPGR